MNHKVLLADDSLTIQKVIKITLANQPYDITDCSTEDELFHKLTSVQPKIVFLDFNLSEKFSGYELTSKIKSLLPSTKVLLLLGTFDTVEDSAMEKCGASDKIVKPFDSNKFIAICKQLIDSYSDNEPLKYPEKKVEERPTLSDDIDEQWKVSHSTEHKVVAPSVDRPAPLSEMNALSKEISDWGMSVPGIINDHNTHDKLIDLPPVIGEVKTQFENAKFPEANDLDYPSTESSSQTEKPSAASLAKLISIESFNDSLEIEHEFRPQESDLSKLQEQIKDEVEEDLWKVDEFEDLRKEVSAKIDEVKHSFQPSSETFDESLFKPLDEKETIPMAETKVSLDKSEIEEMVKKYVKEYMDEMFKKNVEKVTWEVIPDLAENLIRQELTKISNKIINDQH